MINKMNKLLSCLLTVVMIVSLLPASVLATEGEGLTEEQENAMAMLNHITVLTQEINDSKNSRVYMEEAYSSLINNTYPNAVDGETLDRMTGLLDTMEKYRMINVKRARLKYIYDQSQAQAIRAAIPNPVGLLSAVESYDPVKLVTSVVYMAVDSYTSYTAYKTEAEQQYLEDGWALDDNEAETLHQSRKDTFEYMIEMVNRYNLPGDLALTEDTVSEFVKYKGSDNVASKIRFLESNKQTYQAYGGYWLALADGYYNNGDYRKCLQAISTYESMGTRIFRRDYDYAKTLPLAIAAASETYEDSQYEEYASTRASAIVDNTDNDDWALRYFAAETLVDLYTRTGNKTHLRNGYDIALDSINSLTDEQKELNATYLAAVKEKEIPKDADDDTKKPIEEYNKMLHDTRTTEVPPVCEPLTLNCDMLFAIANELELSNSEKAKVDGILHPNGSNLFLTEAIDARYWFGVPPSEPEFEDPEIEFVGTGIIMPATYVTDNSRITVVIESSEDEETTTIKDWKVTEVKRETEGDLSTFEALYTSDKAHSYQWVPDSTITVTITPDDGNKASYTCKFKTVGTKDDWWDYLKVWEGQKNNWWDYLKVWENSVVFERVK